MIYNNNGEYHEIKIPWKTLKWKSGNSPVYKPVASTNGRQVYGFERVDQLLTNALGLSSVTQYITYSGIPIVVTMALYLLVTIFRSPGDNFFLNEINALQVPLKK